MSNKAKGYTACNELLDGAAQSIRANPNAPISLPWLAGAVGIESKILLSLSQKFGAMGVACKGEGARRKFKFYYSRATTGNWLTEVWPLWKTSLWFVVLAFLAIGFYQVKSGAGCFAVGLLSFLAFGVRAVAALRNSVVAAKLSGYAYARESYPLLMAGAVLAVVMLEWAYVLPWNVSGALDLASSIGGVLALNYGFGDFVAKAAKTALTVAVFAVGSVLAYQVAGVGMMRNWLQTANNEGLLFAHPEAGTWFHKLMVTGSNPAAGLFMFAFVILALCSVIVPLLH